jgi:hypothetical protein
MILQFDQLLCLLAASGKPALCFPRWFNDFEKEIL